MSVGIPESDEDHKRFISLVNQFNRSAADRVTRGEVKKRLQDIVDDADRHFAHEDKLFKEWQYPDSDDHARKHAQIIQALQWYGRHQNLAKLTGIARDHRHA